jgi:hypothetical protein
MNSLLEPVKDILRNFLSQMEKKEEIWKSLGKNIAGTPGFGDDEMDPWPRKEACCWVFADLYDHFGRFDRTAPTVDAAHELAKPHYKAWLNLNLESQIYPKYIIKSPKKGDTIESYLRRISSKIHKDKYCKSHRWESLRSFTAYLRQIYPKDEQGFIEEIFPEEMELFFGRIKRIEPPTVYPIDIYITADILKSLASTVLEGRTTAQFCAAEALGFSWTCLTSARRRLPTQWKLMSEMPFDSLIPAPSSVKLDKKGRPLLMVPTFYGPSPAPISSTMFNYLQAMQNILPHSRETFFQSHPKSLLRSLENAVKKLPSAANLGKITFLTLLSHPHEARDQR